VQFFKLSNISNPGDFPRFADLLIVVAETFGAQLLDSPVEEFCILLCLSTNCKAILIANDPQTPLMATFNPLILINETIFTY
jgi:hypothetical protein